MDDFTFIALILLVFLIAGGVKGVVGLGLPTVSLAILATFVSVTEAIVLMLVPSLVANVWQALVGGELVNILKRTWTLLAAAAAATFVGADILADADAVVPRTMLGVLLVIYAVYGLTAPQIPEPGRHEGWLSPVMGAFAGLFTGLTGTFVIPGVLYLQALRLPRDTLIQAMGLAFTLATVSLAAALGVQGLVPADLGWISAAAVVPALIGMVIGQWVRQRIPEETFRQVFFAALGLVGVFLAARAWI